VTPVRQEFAFTFWSAKIIAPLRSKKERQKKTNYGSPGAKTQQFECCFF